MIKTLSFFFVLCLLLSKSVLVRAQIFAQSDLNDKTASEIKPGAEQIDQYLPSLTNKRVALLVNQTSLVNKTPLADTLIALGIKVVEILAPEHGYKGSEDAGATIENGNLSNIKVISLYGKHNKPTEEDLKNIDVVVYDLQDVGVRFFTYISTLHLAMEACAEQKKEFIVLDRPDPNGYYVDGPVLVPRFKSFSGMDPVPVVYGMTPAEYAQMLNGEKWLENGVQCKLLCISATGYSHKYLYQLPVKPSPNLPDMASVYLYPSLGFFEGTVISVGRGTANPFQVIGCPTLANAPYSFTPESVPGATHPMYEGQKCLGYDLRDFGRVLIKNYQKLYLFWLKGTYKDYSDKQHFFNPYFTNLAGNDILQQQIEQGLSDDEIRKSWEPALSDFKKIRKKYLLYEDF